MVSTFNSFIGGFLGVVVDFLSASPIIYFVCLFILVFIVGIIKTLIKVR